jgi:heptosyltransferase-3
MNNPHIEKVFVYKKAKHKARNETTLGVYLEHIHIILKLRTINFDGAILANPVPGKYSLRLARMARVKNIIGADLGSIYITHPFKKSDFHGKHQIEHA